MTVSYTYTLTNGTTADASKVMQNFNDVKAVVDAISPVKGSGVVYSSGGVNPVGAIADIPGATVAITPTTASTLMVVAIFGYELHSPNSSSTLDLNGFLAVDGTADVANYALAKLAPSTDEYLTGTMVQAWSVPLTASAHTVKLRTSASSVFGTASASLTKATLAYLLI